jgi:6-phosphogluconolactonase
LGNDRIYQYLFHHNGRLIPNGVTKTLPGAMPRHMAWHPDGKSLFLTTEGGNALSQYSIIVQDEKNEKAQGQLKLERTVLMNNNTNSTTQLGGAVHCTDAFVIVSNRGWLHSDINNLVVFTLSNLTVVGTGHLPPKSIPRDFTINMEEGRVYVANQNANNVMAFDLNKTTGALVQTKIRVRLFQPVVVLSQRFTAALPLNHIQEVERQ